MTTSLQTRASLRGGPAQLPPALPPGPEPCAGRAQPQGMGPSTTCAAIWPARLRRWAGPRVWTLQDTLHFKDSASSASPGLCPALGDGLRACRCCASCLPKLIVSFRARRAACCGPGSSARAN